MIVLEASDVFMLGCTFIEVLTGCSREPYDWLMKEDPSGNRLVAYRASDATRNINPLVVRAVVVKSGGARGIKRCGSMRPHRTDFLYYVTDTSCGYRLRWRRENATYGPSTPTATVLAACCLLSC